MAVNLAALRQAAAPASGRSHASAASSNPKPVGLAALRALSREQPSGNGHVAQGTRATSGGPVPTQAGGALHQGGFHADEAGRAVSPIQPSPSHYRTTHHDRATPIVAKRWSPSQQAAMAAAEHEAAVAAQRLRETAAEAHSALSPDASHPSPVGQQHTKSSNQPKQKSARVKLGEPATGFRSMKYVLCVREFRAETAALPCSLAATNGLAWMAPQPQLLA